MLKRITKYFQDMTRRNWGMPWHFIIAAMATKAAIVLLPIVSVDDMAGRIYTAVFCTVAVFYEFYQIRFRYETLRGAIEDLAAAAAAYFLIFWGH